MCKVPSVSDIVAPFADPFDAAGAGKDLWEDVSGQSQADALEAQRRREARRFRQEQAAAEEARRLAALEAQQARFATGREASRRATGRSSTLLTGPQGLLGSPSTASAQLLPG